MKFKLSLAFPLLSVSLVANAGAQNPVANIQVDAGLNRHAIDPRIYGVAFASQAQLSDLNSVMNRSGGNNMSRYNWMLNAVNLDADWYFESIGDPSDVAGEQGDTFFSQTKAGGADALLTIPMIDWIANLGPNRSSLASFSVAKYGPQTDSDPNFPDAGNGISKATGQPIAGNDPNDANVPNSSGYEMQWVKHLIDQWGTSLNGGVKYYCLDNEPSIWHSAHRDVQPVGLKMDDYLAKVIDYAGMIKSLDPDAQTLGPEEWGWDGYFYSGYDQQYGAAHNFMTYPDKAAHGDQDYLPWFLDQMRRRDQMTGQRLLDVFSVHYYPQGGEFGDNQDSIAMQQLRNRSTRSLWDPNYLDESWINDKVQLIPRLKQWVSAYYPGTQIGLTEYNWGDEDKISGATAEADILGILGRERVDLATRWEVPDSSTPTYKAIRLYRNYDGLKSTFGDVSVSANGPNPDDVAVFAAQRTRDSALTVMVIAKYLTGSAPVTVNLANFNAGSQAQAWQLTSANQITPLENVPIQAGVFSANLPSQSITLFVIPQAAVLPPPVAPSFTFAATVDLATVSLGQTVTVSAKATDTGGPLQNGIIDMEIYDANGKQVNQQYKDGQSFDANQTMSYSFNWTPTAKGTYAIKLGAFNADWTTNYTWNDAAATFAVTPPPVIGTVKGDLNGDGKLTISDVTLALRGAVGLIALTPDQIKAADVSPIGQPDGAINVTDVTLLLQAVLGLRIL